MKIVAKPWGLEYWWAENDKYVSKFLLIRKGKRTSLQYHQTKHETIIVASGTLRLYKDGGTFNLHPGETLTIPPGTKHRLEAVSADVLLIESSTPEMEDVVRIEDDYGRCEPDQFRINFESCSVVKSRISK